MKNKAPVYDDINVKVIWKIYEEIQTPLIRIILLD